jgi:hopanoid biosynthesis associated protein HpnK
MVAGEASEEAVRLAHAHPDLSVGLHLVLVDGRPALSPDEIPHLVDASGLFPFQPVLSGLRIQFSAVVRRELKREIRAQLERFRSTGLRLSHVDGHHHFHLHPVVLSALLELSAEFSIPMVRLPREEMRLGPAGNWKDLPPKLLWSTIFRRIRGHFEEEFLRAGIAVPDRVYGFWATGRMTEAYLLQLIPRIPVATAELYLHPDAEPSAGRPGSVELEALLSPRVRQALSENGFALANSAVLEMRRAG